MKLGISAAFPHSTPEEWARKHSEAGLSSVVFPLDHAQPVSRIDSYVKAARDFGLAIAEVGAWCNPFDPLPEKRAANRAYMTRQLELAEYVGAACCVNISGAKGEIWDGYYPDNFSDETYAEIVAYAQEILDAVRPSRTSLAIEPMPNMFPDTPDSYLSLLRDIDRPGFGVHVDIVNMMVSPRVLRNSAGLIRECFSKLGPYVRSCHLKDASVEHALTVSILETDCGKGSVDLAAYLREADSLNSSIPMIIEHLPSMERYLDSIHYVRGLAERLGISTRG